MFDKLKSHINIEIVATAEPCVDIVRLPEYCAHESDLVTLLIIVALVGAYGVGPQDPASVLASEALEYVAEILWDQKSFAVTKYVYSIPFLSPNV